MQTEENEDIIQEDNFIHVYGARVHNLRNVDVSIPRDKLTVITGISGSGKSSLAFDTIYAEGQRRYIDTMSSYARQFLGGMERPDVDKISGLSPVISIEQKTTNKNPRSTVGTTTEIYDFLRLLYARASIAYSMATGEKMLKYTSEKIIDLILDKYDSKPIYILAPIVKGRKGHYRELFEQILRKGFLNVRVNGEIREILPGMKLERYKTHNIEIVIDKLKVSANDADRLKKSVEIGMDHGGGVIMIQEKDSDNESFFSKHLMCPTTGMSYSDPAPHSFSFNSPAGACPRCNGLGEVTEISIDKIIPDKSLSIRQGAIEPIGKYKNSILFWQLEAIAVKYKFSLNTPFNEIPEEAVSPILYGTTDALRLQNTPLGTTSNYAVRFDGIVGFINNQDTEGSTKKAQKWAGQFIQKITCPECHGTKLKEEALQFKFGGKNIAELTAMDISELAIFLDGVNGDLTERQKKISAEILKEIKTRLTFLLDVGLYYLSLSRSSRTLSGGESQRIRLATQIGSQLVNVLYILDEPSIGLHQRDNVKLISSLEKLRDSGNSVIVVEHDKDMMLSADYIVDIGPGAGRNGGKIVGSGTPKEILKSKSLTAQYLTGEKKIEFSSNRRKGNGKSIFLMGASGHNLQDVNVKIPLGMLVCVTGVSGSGKSSLINQTLHPILSAKIHRAEKKPLPYSSCEGIENINKVVEVNQSPLGRTPRSNPATYTGVFGDIRKLFEKTPEAKIRGYKAGRFSFNVTGGRCETCKGAGQQLVEMNFLPDVYVHCPDCNGKRYNRETLEVKYKGRSISDVLQMTINQAVEFFENIPSILIKIKTLQEVGLGYIKLGQSSTTLSGGESQRVKLAAELSRKDTGDTLYILDEPTTGLHFEDIRVLMGVINVLVDKGNSVIIIEHNLDVVKSADYVIDVGPEGGRNGGKLLFSGTPEELIKTDVGYTAKFLKDEMETS